MTIRYHYRRDDGLGEYRNIYHVAFIRDDGGVWHMELTYMNDNNEMAHIRIPKTSCVGLPEIVE